MEERKMIYLCLAHMSGCGTEVCEGGIRHELGGAYGTECANKYGIPVVECRPVWKPMHKQPVYTQMDNGQLTIDNLENGIVRQTSDKSVAYINGVSEDIFKVGFCLPAGPYVTDDDVRYIVECIKEAIA